MWGVCGGGWGGVGLDGGRASGGKDMIDRTVHRSAWRSPALPCARRAHAPLPRPPAVARQAELEAAAADGRSTVTVELEDGGGRLEVALGEEYVTDAASGRSYQIKWGQDDLGALQVLRAVPVDHLPPSASSGSLAAAAPQSVEMTCKEL